MTKKTPEQQPQPSSQEGEKREKEIKGAEGEEITEEKVEQEAAKADHAVDRNVKEVEDAGERAPGEAKEEVGKVAKQAHGLGKETKQKISFWEKPKVFWEKAKETGRRMRSSKESQKMISKAAYDTASTIFGFKFITDLAGVLRKKGDIYNYFKQRGETKEERKEIEAVLNEIAVQWQERRRRRTGETKKREKEELAAENKELKDAVADVKERLKNAKSLPEAEKKEFKKTLGSIVSGRSKEWGDIKDERDKKTNKVLGTYLKTKIRGTKLVRDFLNTLLTGTGMMGLRGFMYAGMAGVERAQEASIQFSKAELSGRAEELKGKSKIEYVFKDMTVNAATETGRALVFKGKTPESKHKGAEFVQAFGKVLRIVGIGGVAASEILNEGLTGSVETATNKLLDAFEQGGVVGLGGQIKDNFVDNAERMWHLFDIGSEAGVEEAGVAGVTRVEGDVEPPLTETLEPVEPIEPEAVPPEAVPEISPEQIELAMATVGKGEGIEHSLIRQLTGGPGASPEEALNTAKSFGYDPDSGLSVEEWAGKQAHRIAIDQGYVKAEGGKIIEETRVGPADKV
ncbi:hypothetical protein MYX07_06530, partial [Patescibacteria group bacterium AH-259-L07]|nr:hypothetical protein [Patescibacteria group bacterium AH-259-L07]